MAFVRVVGVEHERDAGVAMRGDELYASYYTSPPERDFTWIMGMFRPSIIRMARIDLRALERLAWGSN